MYSLGSQECLKNAEKLLDDAKILMDRKSFGTAQSLSVTALEEVGKAIILELADLNYVGKDVVERSMKDHIPKKLIMQAIEKGLVLRDEIVRVVGKARIDKEEVNNLLKLLKRDVDSLESKRQNGLYVQINVTDGSIEKSPTTISANNVHVFVERVAYSVRLGKILCGLFREFKQRRDQVTINNLRILRDKLDETTISYDEA